MAADQESRTESRPSVFCLAEGDGPRADLVSRQEVKYVAPHTDVATLRRLLETNGRRLVYNKPVSTVRSLSLIHI